ncbi:unknown [Corallococcus sp. CAG:1435]|nr:unknown [Corallococcus sp. CAG:1435]
MRKDMGISAMYETHGETVPAFVNGNFCIQPQQTR